MATEGDSPRDVNPFAPPGDGAESPAAQQPDISVTPDDDPHAPVRMMVAGGVLAVGFGVLSIYDWRLSAFGLGGLLAVAYGAREWWRARKRY